MFGGEVDAPYIFLASHLYCVRKRRMWPVYVIAHVDSRLVLWPSDRFLAAIALAEEERT